MKNTVDALRDWHVYLVIIFAGVVLYGKSLTYEFTYMDDIPLLVVNQDFLSNLANMPKLFTTDVFIAMANPILYYRPLLNLLFMLEMQIAKETPLLYHITNLLLHIGCSLLVYKLFRQLGLLKVIAGMAALIFCVHPLNTSAVVWIPGRNDTLLTLLVLGSFLLFLRAWKTRRIGAFAGHAFLFFLALLTKESALVLPLICISYVLLLKEDKPRRITSILVPLVYILIIGLWFLLRSLVQQTFEIHRTSGWLIIHWFSNLPAFLLYLGKIIFPFNHTIYPNLTDNSLFAGVISIFVLSAMLFLRPSESRKMVYLAFGWFFFYLAPSFLQGPIFYEHRAYCSFVWFLLAIAHFPMVQKIDFSKSIHLYGFGLLLVLFAVSSALYAGHYRDRYTFAISALNSAPSITQSYSCLAGLYLDEGNDGAAEYIIRKGIARDPNMNIMHRMLGDIYVHRGEYSQAAEEYETSLRLEPLHLTTYTHYGKMCLDLGKTDAAVKLFKTSVQINPEYILGYYYLINYYIHSKNDPDSAMVYVREIQKRGIVVLPELLQAIEQHPSYKK